MSMEKALDQKTFDYIATLEKTGEELLGTLNACVKFLTELKSSAKNPSKWQKMLDVFQETINVAERTVEEKSSLGGRTMAEKLDAKERTNFEELLMASAIQLDAVTRLLIKKGLITEEEFFNQLEKTQYESQRKRPERKGG